jgi:2-polyprenyl-3-methyl-5-hydroxy-6-metoxy-1,4-benzoquinol methylase
MSWLTKWSRAREAKRLGYRDGRPEDLWRTLIARHAPGRTFVDVGCMWNVDGDYAFVAAQSGAAAVTGIDVAPATEAFLRRNAELGAPVRFLRGDLNDPAIEEWAGTFDVVFCSGVLYHVPNPVHSLSQLRRLCRETLILATASMPERDLPATAVLLTGLDDAARAEVAFASRHRKAGLDTRFEPDRGYANWVWLPTPSCVGAMATLAGFTVRELHASRRVTTVVAVPSDAPSWTPIPRPA